MCVCLSEFVQLYYILIISPQSQYHHMYADPFPMDTHTQTHMYMHIHTLHTIYKLVSCKVFPHSLERASPFSLGKSSDFMLSLYSDRKQLSYIS